MNQEQKRAIFGLNFLQDMKGDSTPITGAYDPEQGLWISEGQVLAANSSSSNPPHTSGSTVTNTGGNLVQTLHPGYGITIDVAKSDTEYDVRTD